MVKHLIIPYFSHVNLKEVSLPEVILCIKVWISFLPASLNPPLLYYPLSTPLYIDWFLSVFKQLIYFYIKKHTHILLTLYIPLTTSLPSPSIFCQKSGNSILYSLFLLPYSLPHLSSSKRISSHNTAETALLNLLILFW